MVSVSQKEEAQVTYVLRYDKEKMELVINNWANNFSFRDLHETSKGIFFWNDTHVLAENRYVLRLYAKELQEKWLKEATNRVNDIKKIKVRVKY